MKTLAIIQARMSSTRLPGKSLLLLAGKPVIQRVYERTQQASGIDKVIVATTVEPQDDILADFCSRINISVYRGSEKDVLDRYYQAAKFYDAEEIVRITGDCPLIDPHEITNVVHRFGVSDLDYLSNSQPQRYPLGLNVSIGSFYAFKKSWQETKAPSDREHVTQYIRNHPEKFKVGSIVYEQDYSFYNWSLDTPTDYKFLSRVYYELEKRNLYGYFQEVLKVLAGDPDLMGAGMRLLRG